MKAILIVDIPEEFENRGPYFVEGTLFYHIDDNPYTNYCYAFNIGKTKLKPLPQKKILDEELFMSGNFRLIQARFTGWNDCIDEILGETE